MKNGKEQLIAKVQHFYDVLTNAQQQNEDGLLLTDDKKEKEHRKSLNDNYQWLTKVFTDVFKEFLYRNEPPEN